jgi:hypothetical protein
LSESEAFIRGSGSGSTPKCHGSATLLQSSVADPNPGSGAFQTHGFRIGKIQIRDSEERIVNADPDPAALKFTKIIKQTSFPAFQKDFCTFVWTMFFTFSLLAVYFSCKNSTLWDCKVGTGSGFGAGTARIRIGFGHWIRIRIYTAIKGWIQISIITNVDPHHTVAKNRFW